MPSEKCAGGWGSDDDDMRMITVSFVRAIEQFAGALALHFLPLCQQVVAIRKTRNQLITSFNDHAGHGGLFPQASGILFGKVRSIAAFKTPRRAATASCGTV